MCGRQLLPRQNHPQTVQNQSQLESFESSSHNLNIHVKSKCLQTTEYSRYQKQDRCKNNHKIS